MRYSVLGPVEVHTPDGHLLHLRQRRQLALLCVLAVRANRAVPVAELIGALWEGDPPDRARATLRTHVWALRRLLDGGLGVGPGRTSITTGREAYRLEVADGEVDLLTFRRLARDARRSLARGQSHDAVELLGRAAALWRGDPCEDVPLVGVFADEVAALIEERLTVQEELNELRLTLGQHDGMVVELSESVRRFPLRERMWGQLMLALHLQGRQAEALETYERLRRLLVDQLGVGPGPEVRRRHGEILAADRRSPTAGASIRDWSTRARSVPAQLPRNVGLFTGRRTELTQLDEVCGRGGLALIDGIPGAGKTALTVRFAHQIADRFPDGQLYVDLRGFGPEPPTPPSDVLAQFARALGVGPDDLPTDPDQRAALFRTLTAQRRLLVVLDNARSAHQVRPLLTGTSDSLVLVTSRNRLNGLVTRDGAVRVTLDVVGEADALDLLGAVIGKARVDGDRTAVGQLVQLCGGLPLALRVAAERVVSHRSMRVRDLVTELTAVHERLNALATDDDDTATIRSVFSWSLRAVAPPAARLFALLGLHPGAEFSTLAAAALAGADGPVVRRLLDALCGGHLIEYAGPDRYRFHDLLRLYAAEVVRELPAPERAAASRRIHSWYLHSADSADRMLIRSRPRVTLDPSGEPGQLAAFADIDDALAWCETERTNLVAAVSSAVDAGEFAIAWQLPVALWGFFMLRKYRDDWVATTGAGLDAARRAGDRSGESWALTSLGVAYADWSRFAESLPRLREALAIRRELGDRVGEGTALVALACMRLDSGDLDSAEADYVQALAIYRETADRWSEGIALTGLGVICARRHDIDGAERWLELSVALSRTIEDPWGEAMARHALGTTYRDAGRHDDAIPCLSTAVEIQRTIGDRWGQGASLFELGRCLCGVGRLADAARVWQEALPILAKVDVSYADTVRTHLAELAAASP